MDSPAVLRRLSLVATLAATSLALAPEPDTMRLFDLSDPSAAAAWRPVHDGVMGGVSSGRATPIDDAVRFTGELSLDNNGGFASFRVDEGLPDLDGYDGVSVRARGDGQVYKLLLRADGPWQDVSWQCSFATVADEWTDVALPFEDFAPTWRGRLVTDAPPLDASRLVQVGVSIADEQAGRYAIDLASIDAWRADGDAQPGSRAAERRRSDALASAIDDGVDADGLATMLRWDERVLVISSPSELDAASSIQTGRAMAARAGFTAREIRLVQLFGERGGRLAGRTLSPDHVDALRARWDLDARAWAVALIGKDGGVKERWASVVDVAEVFARIDAMPMRRREIAERESD